MQNCSLSKSGEEISGYLGLLYFLSRTGDHLMNSWACLWDAHSGTVSADALPGLTARG